MRQNWWGLHSHLSPLGTGLPYNLHLMIRRLKSNLLEQLHDLIYFPHIFRDARNMARDVQNTFLKIAQQNGGLNEEGAQKWLREMERQRRYQADVWS